MARERVVLFYPAAPRRKSSKLTTTANGYKESIVSHTRVGMAVYWTTLGGVIHVVFYMTSGTILDEVCRAAAQRICTLGMELDMHDFTYPPTFYYPYLQRNKLTL